MARMRRSLYVIGATVLVGLVSLIACESPAVKPGFTLRIGVFPAQDFLPYFVMQEQGFDKQNGLRFEEKSYSGGAAAIEDMVAGSLDVCPSVGAVPVFLAAERGSVPGAVVPVAANDVADPDHPAIGVLVPPSVKDWNDLRGKQIAVNALDSIVTAAIRARLSQEGIQDYRFVQIAFPNMGLAVAGGNVSAASMYEPFLTQSVMRGDGRVLDWIAGAPPFNHFHLTSIVFSGAFLRARPEAVRAFLRGHLEAVRWIQRHQREARDTLARRLVLTKEVGEKVRLANWPVEPRHDALVLERMQASMVKIGLLKAVIPARQLYDETLLNEVLAEKR
jgi:NitT/TauT family transport system substrate-binding protein